MYTIGTTLAQLWHNFGTTLSCLSLTQATYCIKSQATYTQHLLGLVLKFYDVIALNINHTEHRLALDLP